MINNWTSAVLVLLLLEVAVPSSSDSASCWTTLRFFFVLLVELCCLVMLAESNTCFAMAVPLLLLRRINPWRCTTTVSCCSMWTISSTRTPILAAASSLPIFFSSLSSNSFGFSCCLYLSYVLRSDNNRWPDNVSNDVVVGRGGFIPSQIRWLRLFIITRRSSVLYEGTHVRCFQCMTKWLFARLSRTHSNKGKRNWGNAFSGSAFWLVGRICRTSC